MLGDAAELRHRLKGADKKRQTFNAAQIHTHTHTRPKAEYFLHAHIYVYLLVVSVKKFTETRRHTQRAWRGVHGYVLTYSSFSFC